MNKCDLLHTWSINLNDISDMPLLRLLCSDEGRNVVWLSVMNTNILIKLNPTDGTYETVSIDGLTSTRYMSIDGDSNIYFVNDDGLRVYDRNLILLARLSGHFSHCCGLSAGGAVFFEPEGIIKRSSSTAEEWVLKFPPNIHHGLLGLIPIQSHGQLMVVAATDALLAFQIDMGGAISDLNSIMKLNSKPIILVNEDGNKDLVQTLGVGGLSAGPYPQSLIGLGYGKNAINSTLFYYQWGKRLLTHELPFRLHSILLHSTDILIGYYGNVRTQTWNIHTFKIL